VRSPIEELPTIDECLDDELERAREQTDASARELSVVRASITQLTLELVRLKAIAKPTRLSSRSRLWTRRVRVCVRVALRGRQVRRRERARLLCREQRPLADRWLRRARVHLLKRSTPPLNVAATRARARHVCSSLQS
jgi:hypothetical protein